jgi:hypothetical protein
MSRGWKSFLTCGRRDLRDRLCVPPAPARRGYTARPENTKEWPERAWNLSAGWETECKPEVVKEVRGDLEELWKLMVEKSGLSLFDTMTGGDGAIIFIEHVDPGAPSTVPDQISSAQA